MENQHQSHVASASNQPSTLPNAPANIINNGAVPAPRPNMKRNKSNLNSQTTMLAIVIVIAGIASGYGLNRMFSNRETTPIDIGAVSGNKLDIEVGKAYGSDDEDAFPDEARGVLIKGGFEGEGTHRLLRPGGESQTICLTSSIMDLSIFEEHEVVVWGATFDTQKCPWFMDAGRVKPVTLNAQMPFEMDEE